MIIVIGDNKLETKEKTLYLKSICEIKKINSNENLLFIFDCTVNNGLINEDVFIDELLITVDFKYVFSNVYDKSLEEACLYYKIPFIYLKNA